MPLPANWTTEAAAEKSVAEIMQLLARHGARKVLTEYARGSGDVLAISFIVEHPQHGEMPFKLPANAESVKAVLLRERRKGTRGVTPRVLTDTHARNVAWRIVKDWLRAQLALIELEMVGLDAVMLPYLITRGGKPMYETLAEGGFRALLPPPMEED